MRVSVLSSQSLAGRPELKLATALFQNLFPAINVQTAKLSTCQVSSFQILENYPYNTACTHNMGDDQQNQLFEMLDVLLVAPL